MPPSVGDRETAPLEKSRLSPDFGPRTNRSINGVPYSILNKIVAIKQVEEEPLMDFAKGEIF